MTFGEEVLTCDRCGSTKPLKDFRKSSVESCAVMRVIRCKSCDAQDRMRYHLKSAYGITLEEFQEMEQQQNGCCSLCGGAPQVGEKRLGVFMSRTTRKLRALLCTNCLQGLGKFRHSPELLRRAAEILEG